MNVDEQLSPVDIAVDFGSTNTSLAYCNNAHHEQAYPLNLTNRRVSLLNDKRSQVVAVNDLLFFQNVDVEGNAVKSMLALHDLKRLRVSANGNGQSVSMVAEFAGNSLGRGGYGIFRRLFFSQIREVRIRFLSVSEFPLWLSGNESD